jgi:hypothetical protein
MAPRRAGQNIRELAVKRKVKAIMAFASAALVLVLPFALTKLFEDLLQLSRISDSPSQSTLDLPPAPYLLCVIAAAGLVFNGTVLWKRAKRADQGAKGEEDVATTLTPLASEGWQIEYGMRLGNRLGDADIVCISPQGKAYVIDVKSHRGTVINEQQQLYRRIGQKKYPFEKDFLKQAMKQALQVKKQKGLKFVTPIVAFSEAQVSVPSGKIQHVYVVQKTRLVVLLKGLG